MVYEVFFQLRSIDRTYGDEAEEAVSQASQHIAQLVGATAKEVVFTSGATESINLAILGSTPSRIAVSPVEHKAVLDTCDALAKKGKAEIISLQVDSFGRLDLEHLEQVCKQAVSLLCVMAANNEIGNIYPIPEIGKIKNTTFPSSATLPKQWVSIPSSFNNEESLI